MATAAVQHPVTTAPPAEAPPPTEVATPASDLKTLAKELVSDLSFNPEEIKKRYAEERDKRLRPDGNSQYKQFKGQFQRYLTDPYMPRQERDPLDVEVDFMVLGGGFGGLCLAARLMEAGITNIKVLDKAGDFGGTWYWNRYPGAACDIEAYIYMPLLEETGYIPSEKYAKAPELLSHCRRIGEKFGLYEKALFHTEVRKFTWDETATRWIIETDRGDKIRARFAASASGPLNMPKLPGVEGIEKFKGHSFHTSRWDYDYTGGTLHGNLDKIGDKKVGFIGTGATAIQSIPHLGDGVQRGDTGRLYVFQRTPSAVFRRDNKPTDPEWTKTLEAGWHEKRQENFLRVLGGSQEDDLVQDGWTIGAKWFKDRGLKRTPEVIQQFAALFELADMQNMENVRRRCEEIVGDKETADALKPWFRQFCKRPCFHDEYLDTYNLSNVTLVDTNGQGIERITEKGIVANGKEYELDCIVYGTGFEVGTEYSRRSNFQILGRNGLDIQEKWNEGAKTLHGFFTREFPNLFIVSTLQSGYAANFVHMLSRQAKHIAWIVKTARERDIKQIEATEEAEEAWTEGIVGGTRRNFDYQKECTPGYYNLEGQITQSLKAKRHGSYAAGPLAFCKIMEDWREKGDFEGLDLTKDETAWEKPSNGVHHDVTNGVNGVKLNGEANGDIH